MRHAHHDDRAHDRVRGEDERKDVGGRRWRGVDAPDGRDREQRDGDDRECDVAPPQFAARAEIERRAECDEEIDRDESERTERRRVVERVDRRDAERERPAARDREDARDRRECLIIHSPSLAREDFDGVPPTWRINMVNK